MEPRSLQQGRAHLRTVKTKYNVSDAGAMALSQRRILFLLYLCNYVDVETDEPVGLDIFLEESTREQKAMAVKNISQISRIFSDVDVPSVAQTQNAKQILQVMIALMCATHAKAAENALGGTDENSTVWWTSLERADGVDMFIGFCIFTSVCVMIFAAWKIFSGVFRFATHKVQSWHQASEPENEDMPAGMVRINGIPYVPYHPDELEQRAERASAAENERLRATQHGGARYHRADEFPNIAFPRRCQQQRMKNKPKPFPLLDVEAHKRSTSLAPQAHMRWSTSGAEGVSAFITKHFEAHLVQTECS